MLDANSDFAAVERKLGLPLFVKPACEGSSIGVTKVRGYSDMQDAVALSARYDPDVLCEEFIEGEEVTCPVLGYGATARALLASEIPKPTLIGKSVNWRRRVTFACTSATSNEAAPVTPLSDT